MFASLKEIPAFFWHPVALVEQVKRLGAVRADMVAGLTVAVILLPQAIAYALIAELPPEMGLYTAIVGALVGALWGSSHHLHTGPTNTSSLLVLTVLLPLAAPGTPRFLAAAGLLAVMVGLFRLLMGLARLGVLVNFISDSVIIGFTAGAGVLIASQQLRSLFGLQFPTAPSLVETVVSVSQTLPQTHLPTALVGLGTMGAVVLFKRFLPRLPGPLVAMAVAAALVASAGLGAQGVEVIGAIPRSLPPLAQLPLLDLRLIGDLSTGALAVAVIGLVEAMSIARAIGSQTRQRLDNNQELVGQGLASIATGLLSGFPCSGSFTRSAVCYKAGGRTRLAALFSALFVLLAMFLLAPLAAFVPKAALAAVLILTAYGMIDHGAMARIWRGARGDAGIMVVTLVATLLLPLQFAVLVGILMSLGYYILKTSMPHVHPVLPDDEFRHFTHQPDKPSCPQLEIIDVHGDLYFGACSHVEEVIRDEMSDDARQRYMLLRLHSVNHCDMSGINMLENLMLSLRERGGDLFLVRAHPEVLRRMKSTGFYYRLGTDHFLDEDEAIGHLFTKVLDPSICIYECPVRAFRECQNLPKPEFTVDLPLESIKIIAPLPSIEPRALWQQLRQGPPLTILDVREPREFEQGHIPTAHLLPLSRLLDRSNGQSLALPHDQTILCICRSGRRSVRAAHHLRTHGYPNVAILRGGILAWEAAGLLEALGKEEPAAG